MRAGAELGKEAVGQEGKFLRVRKDSDRTDSNRESAHSTVRGVVSQLVKSSNRVRKGHYERKKFSQLSSFFYQKCEQLLIDYGRELTCFCSRS